MTEVKDENVGAEQIQKETDGATGQEVGNKNVSKLPQPQEFMDCLTAIEKVQNDKRMPNEFPGRDAEDKAERCFYERINGPYPLKERGLYSSVHGVLDKFVLHNPNEPWMEGIEGKVDLEGINEDIVQMRSQVVQAFIKLLLSDWPGDSLENLEDNAEKFPGMNRRLRVIEKFLDDHMLIADDIKPFLGALEEMLRKGYGNTVRKIFKQKEVAPSYVDYSINKTIETQKKAEKIVAEDPVLASIIVLIKSAIERQTI